MSFSKARVKMEPDSGGGGGGGDSDGGGSNGSDNTVRSGDADSPPSDLVLVGKIVDHPAPVLERGSGGKIVRVHVDTWMIDLYRSSPWWIELPNVDDVVIRYRKVMVKVVPLVDPSNHSIIGAENGTQGRIRFADVSLALYMNGIDSSTSSIPADGWDMISGMPPVLFSKAWDKRIQLVAGEFKNGKVYITREQLLTERN
jgi:hypothetical protein